MTKTKLNFATIFTVVGLTMLFLTATPVSAQSIEQTNLLTPTQNFGSSNQSDFQNTGSAQNNIGRVPTSGGSADILKQDNQQALQVTGAPAYQPPAKAKNSALVVFLWSILLVSGLCIVGLFIYQYSLRKSYKSTDTPTEILNEFEPPKISNKKPKTNKSKKKKHHR
jgi:hypothetical protein